ncbi:MAG: hypothetical protein QXS55_01830 [Candidatus Woesearchaeota archaeon]
MKNYHISWKENIIILIITIACATSTLAAPKIVAYAPTADTNNKNVNFLTITNESALCRISENNVTYSQMENLMQGNDTEHWLNLSLEDDYYEFYAVCTNLNNESSTPILINFTVDTTPPLIVGSGPSGSISTDYVMMFVATNERANCSYESSGVKRQLESADGFSHQTILSGLSQGPKSYLIRCFDSVGNKVEQVINFYVRSPVYAQISLSKNPPLKDGLYEVTLTASTELVPTPILTYKVDDNIKSIDLVGSGRVWRGYLIIDKGMGNKIGSFSFRGTDYYGTSGDLITSGKLFIIDTVAPEAPILSASSQKDGKINLSIRFEGDNISEFRIYRSSSAGVSYLDYYDKTSETYYVDRNVAEGKTYYYAVSAVDLAGNEGGLSNEVSAIAVKSDVDSELSPQTIRSIGEAISSAEAAKVEIQKRIQKMQEIPSEILDATGLLEEAQNSLMRLEGVISELKGLRTSTSKDEDILSEVSRQKIALRSLLSAVPLSLELTNYSEVEVRANNEDVVSAISKTYPQNSGDLDYIKKVSSEQEGVKQLISGRLVSIIYEGSTEHITFIEDKLILDKEENNSSIVMLIPKNIAEDVSKLRFISKGYTIIQSDPIIGFPTNGKENVIKFVVNSKVSESDLGSIKSVLLKKPTYEKNNISGYSVFETLRSSSKYVGIVMGVFIVTALAFYYFRMGKETFYEDEFSGEEGLLEEKEDVQNVDSVLEELKSIDPRDLSPEEAEELRSRIKRLEEIRSQVKSGEEKELKSSNQPKSECGLKINPLHLYNGRVVRSIEELKRELKYADSDTFNYHVNFERNDLADWIRDEIRDRNLAARLRKARNKEEMLKILNGIK